jgi:hypothetical protein
MANDLIESIKGTLASLQYGVDEDTRAVAGEDFNKRISIRASAVRLVSGGKEVSVREERSMNVIFVKMAHAPSRSYYSKEYKEGESIAPDCWSTDSKTPDVGVENPPASKCADCPMSIKGSARTGDGTACRLSWRTAVVLPEYPEGDVFQLVLPATSVFGDEDNGRWPFRAYVKMLAANNISAGRVVTKMQFDTKASVPTLVFSPVSAVDHVHSEVIQRQGKSQAAENAIKISVFKKKPEATAPAAAAEPVVRKTEAEPVAEKDVPAAIRKWSTKKE